MEYFDYDKLEAAYKAANPSDAEVKMMAEFCVHIVPTQSHKPSVNLKTFNNWGPEDHFQTKFKVMEEAYAMVCLLNDGKKVALMKKHNATNEKGFMDKATKTELEEALPKFNRRLVKSAKGSKWTYTSHPAKVGCYGGWSTEGATKFNELVKLVKECRARRQTGALDARFRLAIGIAAFGATNGKGGYNMEDGGHWVVNGPAHDTAGIHGAAGAAGAPLVMETEFED